MPIVNGFFELTPGESPSHVRVAWRLDPAKPTKAEDRGLQYKGNVVAPSELLDDFETAKTDQKLAEIGSALWNCIAGGVAGVEWEKTRKKTGADSPLRTILDLSQATEDWQALPWETVSDNSYLTLSPHRPFVRLRKQSIGELATGWPRRILVVCGEEEGGRIRVREELEAIEDGLWQRRREIILRVEDRPTEQQLSQTISEFRPHVLHFIGHGDGAALIINTSNLWRLDASHIKDWLDEGVEPAPQLVFLNACRSQLGAAVAKPVPMTPRACRSLTSAFLSNGVPAVVGMAGNIEGEAALILSRRFYQEWLAGEPLDSAITAARKEVKQLLAGTKPEQHLLACLTVASEPVQWMSWTPVSRAMEAALTASKLGDLHQSFVDRNGVRSEIFGAWLRVEKNWQDQPKSTGIVIVQGDDKSGKTDAVRLVLKAMHSQRWIARCQDLDDPSINWLKILRLFTSGTNLCGVLSDKLPSDKFSAFSSKVEDPEIDINDADDINVVFEAWLAGLRATAKETPVALALDRLTSGVLVPQGDSPVLPEYLIHLTQKLLIPLSASLESEPILIILVMNSQEADAYAPLIEAEIKMAISRIRVTTFETAESKSALRQYFRVMMRNPKYNQKFRPDEIDEIQELARGQVEGLLQRRQANMKAGELGQFFHSFMGKLSELQYLIP